MPDTRANKQKTLPSTPAAIDDSFLSQYDIFLREFVQKEIKDADPGIKSHDFDIDTETSDLEELEVSDRFNAAKEWSAASSDEYPESQDFESKDQESQDSEPKEMEQSESEDSEDDSSSITRAETSDDSYLQNYIHKNIFGLSKSEIEYIFEY